MSNLTDFLNGSTGKLVAQITPTAAAFVDFLSVFTAQYDNYMVAIEGIAPSADDLLCIRLANSGTVDATSKYGGGSGDGSGVGAGVIAVLSAVNVGTTGAGVGGMLWLTNVNSASGPKSIVGKLSSQTNTTGTLYYANNTPGFLYIGGAASGFRLLWNAASNFKAQGTVKVYGLANS